MVTPVVQKRRAARSPSALKGTIFIGAALFSMEEGL
jgi:hypothetical protein